MFFSSSSFLGGSNDFDSIGRQMAADRVLQFNAKQRFEERKRQGESSKLEKERLINELNKGRLSSGDSWNGIFKSKKLTTNDKLILFLHSLLHDNITHSPSFLKWLGQNYKDSLYAVVDKCRQSNEGISEHELTKLMSGSLQLENDKPTSALGIIWHTQRGFFKCRPNRGILKKVADDLASKQVSISKSKEQGSYMDPSDIARNK